MASRTRSFPRKLNERFETPPETLVPGNRSFRIRVASMNALPYSACSSIPVAIARMQGSKMMSSATYPARSVRRPYARSKISILRSTVSAWPRSSNAITTTAAPYRLTRRAFSRKSSSPSLRLIEFTTPLPCRHLRPASSTSHFDESTMTGTRAMSGSVAMRLRKVVIAFTPSSRSASMFTSSMFAPLRT